MKNFKKLNIIITLLALSFLSLLLTKETVKAETYSFDNIESETIRLEENSHYYYYEKYFGGDQVTVLVGKFDPKINSDKTKASNYLKKTAGIIERVGKFSDSHRNLYKSNEINLGVFNVNQNVGKKTEIDPWLYSLIELSLEYKEATNGFFDISIGHVIDEWKKIIQPTTYDDVFNTKEELDARIDYIKQIEVNNNPNAIKLEKSNGKYYVTIESGVKLDLGGIAKGFVVELIDLYLKEEGLTDYRIRGSESSLKYGKTQYGNNGGVINDFYKINIENIYLGIPEFDKNKRVEYRVGEIYLRNSSLSTSGDTRKSKKIFGGIYHHIINPKTKEPSTHNRMLAVVHPNATLGDVLSTAMFSMNETELETFLASDFAREKSIEDYLIFGEKKGDFKPNFTKTSFIFNEATWDYEGYDPDSDDDYYGEDDVVRPDQPTEGDEILNKTFRDFIIIAMIVVIATLGFVMFYDAYKKIEGKVTHALVIYDNKEELVKIDFKKQEVEILKLQEDAPGYPIINKEEMTITVLGASQATYDNERFEVVMKYCFRNKSVTIIDETSPENTCSKQGETKAEVIQCLPNKVKVEFKTDVKESEDLDDIL